MSGVAQYNQWKKDNPQSSIIDFCNDGCDLSIITNIISFSKIVESDKLTAEIELKIRDEISRCFSEVIKKTDFGLKEHFRESIEEALKFALKFKYDECDFEYDFSYDIGIEIDDKKFNEYINFKIENTPNYHNKLNSQKNRLRLYRVTEEVPIFLTALAKSIQGNKNNGPISFSYGGFEFKYDNLESLPRVNFDKQIQKYIKKKYSAGTSLSDFNFIQKIKQHYSDQVKNNFEYEFHKGLPEELNNSNFPQYSDYLGSYSTKLYEFVRESADDTREDISFYDQLEEVSQKEVDKFEEDITSKNIYMYMSIFIDLNKMFQEYEEQCLQQSGDLVDGFYDSVTSAYRRIIDGVVEEFDYSVIDNIVTPDQLDNMLDLCAIDDYFENLDLNMDDALSDFSRNRQSVLGQIVKSFEELIKTWEIRETIIQCNSGEIYGSIKNEVMRDENYSIAHDKFDQALTTNDLLEQHRIIVAVTHVINARHVNKTIKGDAKREPLDEKLSSALEKVEHYHKTFVLGNNIDILQYPSKHQEKMIVTDISQILERLQFTGRYLNRQQQIEKVESNISNYEGNITRWQKEISDRNGQIKELLEDESRSEKKRKKEELRLVKQNETNELQSMKAEEGVARLKDNIDLLNKTLVPKKKDKNILVPTFIFTVGYKDEEGKTSKRKFIEVPISGDSLKIISLENFEEGRIQSLVKKTDDSFRAHIRKGKDIDDRDLETKHSFDSERILNAFINDPANIKDIIGDLVGEINKDDTNWNQDGKKCKIYALTILAYSTNATCRNCTRVYIDLANDRSEESFISLLTTEINNTDGLFAYPHGEEKEGIRIRSLVMADYNYHEHQEFVSSHPETLIQRGGVLDAKGSDPKTFVEIVTQKSGIHNDLHQGAAFKSGC